MRFSDHCPFCKSHNISIVDLKNKDDIKKMVASQLHMDINDVPQIDTDMFLNILPQKKILMCHSCGLEFSEDDDVTMYELKNPTLISKEEFYNEAIKMTGDENIIRYLDMLNMKIYSKETLPIQVKSYLEGLKLKDKLIDDNYLNSYEKHDEELVN
jgi:transcription elongation factor Elf1